MSKRGENITKRKDGRWEARYIKYYKNGKAVYGYLYGKTYPEAKKKRNVHYATTPKYLLKKVLNYLMI